MRHLLLFLILVFSSSGCKESKTEYKNVQDGQKVGAKSDFENVEPRLTEGIRDSLTGTIDFHETLMKIEGVQHTGNKHQDWMFNRARTLKPLLELEYEAFKVTSSSYTFKENCIFYLHKLSHTNDSISIRPFVENALGKQTDGYTQLRVLIFAMKNEKQANFIDIPPNYGYSKLDNELISKVYSEINFKVIGCDSLQPCRFKNLGL